MPEGTVQPNIALPELPIPTVEETTSTARSLNVNIGLREFYEPKGIAERYRFYAVLARIREEQRSMQLISALTQLHELRAASEEVNRAFCMSIVNRRTDQKFENECEEYDYWMYLAKSQPSPASAVKGE